MSARNILALGFAALSLSCSQWDLPLKIPFVATWNGTPLSCNSDDPALTDLRFYVSKPQLVRADGKVHDVRFAIDNPWQNDAVALIDLEIGAGACQNA